MRRIHLLFYFCIIAVSSFAQTFSVNTIRQESFDLSATSYPRYDLNGKKCGLVKVQCVLDGLSFKGNIIGDVTHKDGEYWVYMTDGSKQLSIHHSLVLPINIQFSDSISCISSGKTYRITLSIPDELYTSIINGNAPQATLQQSSIRPTGKTPYSNSTVSGTVVDKNGDPIIGCSIQNKNTSQGIITDIDGKYILDNIKENQTIAFSYIGYKKHEVTFTGKIPKTLDVTLKKGWGVEKVDLFYDPDDTSVYYTLKGEKLPHRPTQKGTYLRVVNGVPETFKID